ncbi:hypothetical protein KYT87_11060 [Achromobacter sp. ES-001]|uniref:hypothetical protein n=1 Tax=Achromobacter sp. ES-001 TaxID=2860286 RepID=UPI001C6420CE|nr:hypothetical protein [Achromobacter sp. ES-001]QYJ23702.1 hypothetical protein KYT87_11060 [Achromobacter sp. ES-001]
MTATPPDPLATQHDSNTDLEDQAPVDAQTLRLREENRALRDLLAAQVHAALPQPAREAGGSRRLCWWLISAPGAALVGWRRLLSRDDALPITGRRVGSATLTVLYTLAIYGALVLLIVSWNAPNNGITGATAASPVRVPLMPPTALPADEPPSEWEPDALASPALTAPEAPPKPDPASGAKLETKAEAKPEAATPAADESATTAVALPASRPESRTAADTTPAPAISGPHSTLRVIEIPARDPLAWVKGLQTELSRCAELGFFDRPDCAWAARNQFCEANHGWGIVNECPARP